MANRLEQLEVWKRELLQEQGEISSALEPILKRRDEVRQKLDLIQSLLGLESISDIAQSSEIPSEDPIHESKVSRSIGTELQGAVKEVLEQARKPLHVRDIRAALIEMGQPIPGKGTDANIIVHLRRAPRVFESKNRGIYNLVDPKQ